MAFGTEPVFPFDIEEATYLAPNLSSLLDTETLIAFRARQLEKREDDLRKMKDFVWAHRKSLAGIFELRHKHTIRDYDFALGPLVLVHNSAEDTSLKNKYKP